MFRQVSGYRLVGVQALISTDSGKLLPQLNQDKNRRKKATLTMSPFFHSLWMNPMNRCTWPFGQALS